jgi:peptidoglycan/xylan/chitin deacetylase (PgdA/CDA1 family)
MLKKYNMKAVIFLVSGLDYNRWTVESDNEKRFDLMSDEEVMELQNSGHIEFGGHTLTHVSFFDVDDERAREEIVKDKEITEKRLGKKLKVFAYPYGHKRKEVVEMVKKCGYSFAVSTDTGSGIFTKDLFDIRRTAIDKTSLINFLRRISPRYLQYKARKYKDKF